MTGLSARNPAVKHLRSLARQRSTRSTTRQFIVDGPILLGVALDAGVELDTVFVDGQAACEVYQSDSQAPLAAILARLSESDIRVQELAPGVLAGAVQTTSPQGIAAVARMNPKPFESVTAAAPGFVVVLAGVGDPGNAGAVLRSAEASGAQAVIVTAGSVDIFGPKTVRASAGALFNIPVVTGEDPLIAIQNLQAGGYRCVGAVPSGGLAYDKSDLGSGVAVVLGNEARGLEASLVELLDDVVTIPMQGRAESLNVAMAATLLCFESARQRRSGPR